MENLNLPKKSLFTNSSQADATSGAFHLFLYLTSFLSFSFLFFGLTSVLFEFFDKTLAGDDPLAEGFDQSLVRTAIAFLVIAGPLFYFLLGLLNKKLALKEINLFSGVRKVLTYLFLFFLAAIILGDLVFLLSSFLNGDYTEVFLAKAISLLILASGFGLFYFWEIRRIKIEKKNFAFWQNGILGVIFLVLILGFSIIDKPSVAREKRLDGQVVNQLSLLREEIRVFYSEKKQNPTLEELKNQVSGETRDFLEKGTIKYQPQSSGEYFLCANFHQAWDGKEIIADFWNDSFWRHPQGQYCFEIKENLESSREKILSEELD